MYQSSLLGFGIALAALFVLLVYNFWTGWGWPTYLAIIAGTLAYMAIEIVDWATEPAADSGAAAAEGLAQETALGPCDVMLWLWWFMIGCAAVAAAAVVVRCWRQTGSPLPFHGRQKGPTSRGQRLSNRD